MSHYKRYFSDLLIERHSEEKILDYCVIVCIDSGPFIIDSFKRLYGRIEKYS